MCHAANIASGSCDLRVWHIRLLDAISALPGISINVNFLDQSACTANARLPDIDRLFRFEALIHGIASHGLAAHAPQSAFERYLEGWDRADLVINLCGKVQERGARQWCLTYNELPGESALLSLLLAGQMPIVKIKEDERVVAVGRPGTEHNGVILASFQDVLARMITLISAAIVGATTDQLPQLPDDGVPPNRATRSSLGLLAMKELAYRGARRLYGLCYPAPHWRVGWRNLRART